MAAITKFTLDDGSIVKRCARCRELKPIGLYNKNRDTVQSHCKPCRGQYRSERRRQFPERAKVSDRRGNLRRYGLSPDQWDELFLSQGRACAICRATSSTGTGWHTDHDHNTGRVRGILCHQCNVALGYYELTIRPNAEAFSNYAAKWR